MSKPMFSSGPIRSSSRDVRVSVCLMTLFMVGLLLRKAILVNSLLFTSETWSGVQEAQIRRLEQVDEALLRSLLYSAHFKFAIEFLHLESGTLKLRQILSMNRMMYHHHLLTLDDQESIKKIYNKQREETRKR